MSASRAPMNGYAASWMGVEKGRGATVRAFSRAAYAEIVITIGPPLSSFWRSVIAAQSENDSALLPPIARTFLGGSCGVRERAG